MGTQGNVYSVDFNVQVAKPKIEFVSPTPADNFLTSSESDIMVYSKINDGPTESQLLGLAPPTSVETSTSKTFTKTVGNDAGDVTITRTFYRVNTGVRFFTPTATATSGCTDWAHPCKFGGNMGGIPGAMWLQSGTYDITEAQVITSSAKIYGGIKFNGLSVNDLDKETRIIAYYDEEHGFIMVPPMTLGNGSTLNRITITGIFAEAAVLFSGSGSYVLKNVKFTGLQPTVPYNGVAYNAGGRNVECDGCSFEDTYGQDPFIRSTGETGTLTFRNCNFVSSGSDNYVTIETSNRGSDGVQFLGSNTGRISVNGEPR